MHLARGMLWVVGCCRIQACGLVDDRSQTRSSPGRLACVCTDQSQISAALLKLCKTQGFAGRCRGGAAGLGDDCAQVYKILTGSPAAWEAGLAAASPPGLDWSESEPK